MSNDPNKPAANKTIMGWMPVPTPGQQPGQPPAAPQPPQPGYPPQAQPPGYPSPAQPPQPGYPPAQQPYQPPQQPGFPPAAQPPQPAWGAPPPQAPAPAPYQPPQPAMQPAWGAPPQQPPAPAPYPAPQAPMQPAWGAPPPQGPPPMAPQPQPMMQPAWGAAPQQPPPPMAPQPQPMTAQSWGQPPAQPQPAPNPGWGAPPPQQPAPSPFGGAPNPMGGMGAMGGMSGAPDPMGGSSRGAMGATATEGVSERVRFIRLTYLHLFGAILLFAGLEYVLFLESTPIFEKVSIPIIKFAFGGRYNWLMVLGVFGVVSWIADYWASHSTSKAMQYAGLGLYVVAEALIFLPLLAVAQDFAADKLANEGKEVHIIRDSAILTLAVFGALTASVFFSKKDFSFLRGALAIGSAVALVIIVVSILAGFQLGLLFCAAMLILCAGYVLYYTSQVFAHYNTESYVAAALALFSSIALMFWYVIQLMMKLRE